jgi:class 3 adenylate cyclase
MLADSVELAVPFMVPVGLMGVFAFPAFYVVWRYAFPQPYESLGFRLAGSLLCVPLVFKEYWPERLNRILPLYWQIAVLYSLPFLFSYMALQNAMNEVWLLSSIGAAFLLTFFVEWRSAAVLFVLGSVLAWGLHIHTAAQPVALAAYLRQIVILVFPLTFGCIVNHKLQQYRHMQSTFEKRLRHITEENARTMQEHNQLLSRFLSNTVVRRLWESQRRNGLDDAIAQITRQEKRFCAILQADIRNFTKMFDQESEVDVARVIRLCFTEIAEIGQDLAVIKPVGDSMFMYCDDHNGRETCVQNLFALAILFVRAAVQLSQIVAGQGLPGLNFGIAMHAGDAIYGNLASDTLIDPTIVGIHVNKTARLEALTKVPSVHALIGNNAILLSEEMAELANNFIPRKFLIPIHLDKLGVQVADFTEVKVVYALTAERAQVYYGRAMELIESQRRTLPARSAPTEASIYRGVSYRYAMHGSGPNTSWTMLINVGSLSRRAVRVYANQALKDFEFEINDSDGRWLVVSTSLMPGEFDETDIEGEIFNIIEGLQGAALSTAPESAMTN